MKSIEERMAALLSFGQPMDLGVMAARAQAARPKDFGPQKRMALAKLKKGPPKLQPSGGFKKWATHGK